MELKNRGWSVGLLPVGIPLQKMLKIIEKEKPSAIFNLCEAFNGDPSLEGSVASLWELLGIPYTGSRPKTLILSQDKIKSKILAKNAGILTPEYEVVHDVPTKTRIPFPVVVKPPFEDGSIGISSKSFARNLPELKKAVGEVLSVFGGVAMIERYIEGREFNIAAFGREKVRILPPAEIDFSSLAKGKPRMATYEAKWNSESDLYLSTPSVCPAKISKNESEELSSITLKLYHLFGADAYARADFRKDKKGRVFFLEFNPNPDVSPGSGFRKALNVAKIPFAKFAEEMIDIAMRRKNE